MAEENFCTHCGEKTPAGADYCLKCARPLKTGKAFCKYCGEGLKDEQVFCLKCGKSVEAAAPAAQTNMSNFGASSGSRRLVAILLAFLLGGLGAHKFYLGQIGLGILYLLFCWTFIPAIIGLIEAIIYLTMSDAQFNEKYPAR